MQGTSSGGWLPMNAGGSCRRRCRRRRRNLSPRHPAGERRPGEGKNRGLGFEGFPQDKSIATRVTSHLPHTYTLTQVSDCTNLLELLVPPPSFPPNTHTNAIEWPHLPGQLLELLVPVHRLALHLLDALEEHMRDLRGEEEEGEGRGEEYMCDLRGEGE